MNWGRFKDPVAHMCLAGAMVASRSLTQEVAFSNPFTVMPIILVTQFRESNNFFFGKLNQFQFCFCFIQRGFGKELVTVD